ncbi:uncharacterized protein [Ptychodera flava]|uniref:uncharacterized protein n=1 Tax=Ptychodera flava TaxID=63121 RepID=UPI00396AAA95
MKTVRQEVWRVLCVFFLIRLFIGACSKPYEYDTPLNFTVNIQESSRPGKKVFNFQDTLGNDVYSFHILSGNKDDRFEMRPNGMLVTRGFLDYDIETHYKLHVSFTDTISVNEATLTVTLLEESDWPPFYNSTCETPVYTGLPKNPIDYSLFDVQAVIREVIASIKLRDTIRESNTDNAHCGIDVFIDVVFPLSAICDIPYTLSQLEGPPLREPKLKFYSGRNTFPERFAQSTLVRSDCLGEFSIQESSTSAPFDVRLSTDSPVEAFGIIKVDFKVVSHGCPEGKYGFLCDKDCICQNGATCHGFNGACKCSKEWTGPACDMGRIWVLPAGAELSNGQTFNLSCHYNIEVKSAIGVVWTFFNGVSSRTLKAPLEQVSYKPHSSELTITHFDGDRVGTYQCSVTDQDGVEYTAEATVTYAASSMPVEGDTNFTFTVSIPESSRPGEEVFNFRDALGNNVHSFQILSGNKDDRFKMRLDGILVTHGFLDYDIDAQYELEILFMENFRENEAKLTVTLLNESGWPPFYNSTCETPVYANGPISPFGHLLLDVHFGNMRLADVDFPWQAFVLRADTDNGRCRADIFINVFEPYTVVCDLSKTSYKINQLQGPPLPIPKITFYDDGNALPGNFSLDPLVSPDCFVETLFEYNSASAPIVMVVSVDLSDKGYFLQKVEIKIDKQGCPPGKYGMLCDKDCICQNGASCHGFNGACHCYKGWTGPACDIAVKELWIIPADGKPIYGQIFDLSCHYNFEINSAYGIVWTFFNGSSSRILDGPLEQISYDEHKSQLTIIHFDGERVGTYRCSVIDQDGLEYTAETNVTYAECAENLFGDFCNNTCNCTHAVRCDRLLGCICLDGWTEENCNLDVQAPTIADCPANQTVLADGDDSSAIVSWKNTTIIDNSDKPVVLGSNRESGERFGIGKHEIVMWATDQSNNTAFCNFSVFVAKQKRNAGIIKATPLYLWIILVGVLLCALMLFLYTCIARKKTPYAPVDRQDSELEDYLKEHLPKAALVLNVEKKALKIFEEDLIGEGEFGRVYKARLTIRGGEKEVAAKTICEIRSDAICLRNFVNEVRCLLALTCHPNIISILGIDINGDSKYILTEYASGGDLKTYLKSRRLICIETETLLINVAKDIANGLSFMSIKKIIHKDIAARNVFLTKNFTAKIGDFGLARDVSEGLDTDYHSLSWPNQHCRVPSRWMPPEFLRDGTFTLESDWWSYGIVLWEICSLGGSPMMDVQDENLLEYLRRGRRPMKPEGCTPTAYRLMQRCWHEDRYKRPRPDELRDVFNFMLLRTPANGSQRFFTQAFKERHDNPPNDEM